MNDTARKCDNPDTEHPGFECNHPARREGTYSDGSRVHIEGERGGFVYVTFLDGPNRGTTTKVPPSWVTEDAPAAAMNTTTAPLYTDADVDRIAAQMQREILADIADGTVPADVPDFSTLHDYVDANTYGGLCDYSDPDGEPDATVAALWAAHYANQDGGDDFDSAIFTFANAVQTKVDAWLKAGRP